MCEPLLCCTVYHIQKGGTVMEHVLPNVQSQPDRHTLKDNMIAVILCIAGVVVNMACSSLIGLTGVPLYLDTVGTVTAAILGGYLPGVIVGFLTHMFKSITDPAALYYGILNVMIALTAAYFSHDTRFKRRVRVVICLFLFTIIGGGVGTLLPWYLDGISFDSASLAAEIARRTGASDAAALLSANLITDFFDKLVTICIVLLLVHFLPERVKRYFSFNGWMQTPLSDEEATATKHTNSRVMSLRTKILLVLSLSLIAVAAAATAISLHLYRNALIKDHTKLAEGAATIAASTVNGDRVGEYLISGEAAEGYLYTENLLRDVRNSIPDIKYLYVYKIMQDGCHVVFDLDSDTEEGADPGDIVQFDTDFLPMLPALLAGEAIEPIESVGQYGWLLTSYMPVKDSMGNTVCYAAADVSMDRISVIERNFFIEMISLFLGFFIMLFVVIWWLIEYHIILPVNSIARSAGTFAYDSEEARENSIERIRDLKICTGDEVENLYHAIAKTSDDSMRYVADVQEKTEQISQMQKALIMVLADIVESRDRNTGAHVRKTAAYTEIILHKLRERGYYQDVLTDNYISDVCNSAPLHDIGKIQVPDAILNKPDRLNDDEYNVMKTHTTAGKNIISQAIALVPNNGYLTEARNLAAYHHEKWDGSGYPTGIQGEDIPLSARVMAVADVFDALVSRRSYKAPFSFAKAMGIIKEGSGKHFDPLIVDAFIAAEDEVRRVEQDFSARTNDAGIFIK